MKKSWKLWLALGVLLLVTLACALPASTASLVVINDTSDTTICFVNISPTTDETWGDDWLGEDNVVAPGTQFTITGIEPGDYDLRALDCEGNTLVERRGETLEGSTEWTLTD